MHAPSFAMDLLTFRDEIQDSNAQYHQAMDVYAADEVESHGLLMTTFINTLYQSSYNRPPQPYQVNFCCPGCPNIWPSSSVALQLKINFENDDGVAGMSIKLKNIIETQDIGVFLCTRRDVLSTCGRNNHPSFEENKKANRNSCKMK